MSVVVAVGLLVIGLVYGTYAFGARLVRRWEQRLYMQNAVHLIARRFVEDVRSAQAVIGVAPDRLELVDPARHRVVYRWEGTVLQRKGMQMHPKQVSVVQAVFQRLPSDSSIAVHPLKTALPAQEHPVRLALQLVVAAGKDTLCTRVQAIARQPTAWLAGFPTDADSGRYVP